MKTLTCHCCNAEITAPQFHKGQAYGWTCITKVAPAQKRKRDNGLWIQADSIEYIENGNLTDYIQATVNGLTFKDRTLNHDDHYYGRNVTKGGLVKIAEHSNGTKKIWKHIEIVQKRENNKLIPESVKGLKNQETIYKF